jgi:DNA-binding response OmpR family regulator
MRCDTAHGTILVVDDNVDIRTFAKMFLEHAGYSVATAADGEEGLRYYEKHQSSILLLLTDVMMPKINGLELADRVLGIDSTLPVLFMSGDAWSAFRGLECVEKPFRSDELVERVSRVLNPNIHSQRPAPAA